MSISQLRDNAVEARALTRLQLLGVVNPPTDRRIPIGSVLSDLDHGSRDINSDKGLCAFFGNRAGREALPAANIEHRPGHGIRQQGK